MADNTPFIDNYSNLLILQYSGKPKAQAEITTVLKTYSDIFDLIQSFYKEFDLDLARGKQLNIIGRIVGLSRTVPYVVPKLFFGFDDNSASGIFADDEDEAVTAYPFADKFLPDYESTVLEDETYRTFLRLKIAKNCASGYMSSDDRIGIQEAVINAFKGSAYAVDNKDMTLTLYVSRQYTELMRYILAMKLLPRPEGVEWKHAIIADVQKSFGFKENLNSMTFGDKFDSTYIGGKFADKIIMEAVNV